MAQPRILGFRYWINLLIAIFANLRNGFLDLTGLYRFPSPDPVPVTGNGGRWEGPFSTPVIGAATINLPNGDLLIWSAYQRAKFTQQDLGPDRGYTHTAIINPFAHTSTDEIVVDTEHDMFCPGTAYLPDGRVMITGGTTSKTTTFYHVDSDTWTRGEDMNLGRGYHSMTMLGDGSVFTLGGSFSGGQSNKDGELWRPGTGGWDELYGIKADGDISTRDDAGPEKGDNHMWLFTAPDTDKVFHAGPSMQTHWLDMNGEGSSEKSVVVGDTDRMCGMAVMFNVGKLLVMGGAQHQDKGEALRGAYILDISTGTSVSVEQVGDMIHPRIFASAVPLPSGEVAVFGGQTRVRKFSDLGGVLQAEIFRPDTKTFYPMAVMQIERNYHSSCTLLKDATVACTGGGLCVTWSPLGCDNHFDYEVFTPPYLLNVDLTLRTRPVISTASDSVTLGDTLSVTTDSSCTFAVVRLGVATHTINNDIRRVPLDDVENVSNGGSTFEYTLRISSNANVMLPGLYWLFAMNVHGVPSEGWNVSVLAASS